jgi:predicted MFS family arabinose efflux permease
LRLGGAAEGPISLEEPTTLHQETRAQTRAPRFRLGTFSSLRHVNFRYLWFGTLFMSGGQWIQQVTLGWLLYELTGSSILLGALNGLRVLPFLIASPIAGVAADRMNRRGLILGTQYVLMATAVAMGIIIASGYLQIWHLFVFTLITGCAWAFVDPVRQSVIPNVVPKSDLMNAIALNSSAFNLTKILGPSLGGLLILWFGSAGNFFVQGLAYAAVLVAMYWIEVPPTPGDARRSSALANLKEGLVYVWSNPIVFALMTAALVPRVFAIPYQTLMPVFQKDVLGVGPEGLGMLLAAPGVGAIFAGLFLATLANRIRHQGFVLLGSLILLGVMLNVFSWTRSFPMALLALVGIGVFQILYMATTHTLLQVIVPDQLRGRVMSIYALDRGLMPAGALVAGISSHYVGAPMTVSYMGIVVIVLALLLVWRAPVIRNIGI